MRGTIGTDEACTVDRKPNRKVLQIDVMHNLIVSALQEGRVNRTERA